MTELLEYARPTPKASPVALIAMVCGLCSGPASLALGWLCGDTELPLKTKELLALLTIGTTLVASCAFGRVVRMTLPRSAPRSDRVFANVATAAPIAYTLAIFALLAFVSARY